MDEAIPIILTQPVVFFQLQLFKKRTGMVETALFAATRDKFPLAQRVSVWEVVPPTTCDQ